jgi:hypothetical protein
MPSIALSPRSSRVPALPARARVDIVVPVHDEQAVLARSIRRLHDHLTGQLPFGWRIVIADNASSDDTPRIAAALAADLADVTVLSLRRRAAAGRCGRRGLPATPTSCATWTSTCRPTYARCCR